MKEHIAIAVAAALMLLSAAPASAADEKADEPITDENVLERVDANGNGRITCAEAKAAGLPLPVTAEHPAYKYMRDGDGDGQICE